MFYVFILCTGFDDIEPVQGIEVQEVEFTGTYGGFQVYWNPTRPVKQTDKIMAPIVNGFSYCICVIAVHKHNTS